MSVILVLGFYFLTAISFMAFDAIVGLPVEFDGYENPPLWLVALFWPIAIPCMLAMRINNLFSSIKEKRLEREEKRRKIRIKIENDEAFLKREEEKLRREEEVKYLREVEADLEEHNNERESLHRTRFG